MSFKPGNNETSSNPHFDQDIFNILKIENDSERKQEFEQLFEKKINKYGSRQAIDFMIFSIIYLALNLDKANQYEFLSRLKGLTTKRDNQPEYLNFSAQDIIEYFLEYFHQVGTNFDVSMKQKGTKKTKLNLKNLSYKNIFLVLGLLTGVHFVDKKISDDYFHKTQATLNNALDNKIQSSSIKSMINTTMIICADIETDKTHPELKNGAGSKFCKENFDIQGKTKFQIISNWEQKGALNKFSSTENIKKLKSQCLQELKKNSSPEQGLKIVCDFIEKV